MPKRQDKDTAAAPDAKKSKAARIAFPIIDPKATQQLSPGDLVTPFEESCNQYGFGTTNVYVGATEENQARLVTHSMSRPLLPGDKSVLVLKTGDLVITTDFDPQKNRFGLSGITVAPKKDDETAVAFFRFVHSLEKDCILPLWSNAKSSDAAKTSHHDVKENINTQYGSMNLRLDIGTDKETNSKVLNTPLRYRGDKKETWAVPKGSELSKAYPFVKAGRIISGLVMIPYLRRDQTRSTLTFPVVAKILNGTRTCDGQKQLLDAECNPSATGDFVSGKAVDEALSLSCGDFADF